MSFAIKDVMDSLATASATATGLVAYAYPPDAVTAPCIVVGYPSSIDWAVTFEAQSGVFPVWVLVGRTGDGLAVRDTISDYVCGLSGLVKALGAVDGAAVQDSDIGTTEIAGVAYQSIRLNVEVFP